MSGNFKCTQLGWILMGLTFVVSKLPTSPKGSAFELFYVTVFIAFQKFIDISFQGIFIGAGGKLFFISLRKEIRIPTHFILLYSPAFFCVLHAGMVNMAVVCFCF